MKEEITKVYAKNTRILNVIMWTCEKCLTVTPTEIIKHHNNRKPNFCCGCGREIERN